MDTIPNRERDMFKKYVGGFFNLAHLTRSASDLFVEIRDLQYLIFPRKEENYKFFWDQKYINSVLQNWLSYRDIWRLIQHFHFMIHEVIVYWKSFTSVDYVKNSDGLLTINSMDFIDPYTISINETWLVKQRYSWLRYCLSPQVERRVSTINKNNIRWMSSFTAPVINRANIKGLVKLKNDLMKYELYSSHSSLYQNDHYFPIEKSRYSTFSIEKNKHDIFDLQIRKELSLPSQSYVNASVDNITDYYEIYTLLRAKKKALLIRQILIDELNRILEYLNRENNVEWTFFGTQGLFWEKDFDNVFELFKNGDIDKTKALNAIYLEDLSYLEKNE